MSEYERTILTYRRYETVLKGFACGVIVFFFGWVIVTGPIGEAIKTQIKHVAVGVAVGYVQSEGFIVKARRREGRGRVSLPYSAPTRCNPLAPCRIWESFPL